MNFHLSVLPRATQKAVRYCSEQPWLKTSQWYLAGGTALALQVGHRASYDLDFFTQEKDFNANVLVERFPKDVWATDFIREGTLYGKLLGAKVSFISNPQFIPHEPYEWYGSIRMLIPKNIGVMKITAISERGRKRDFVDLYWLCRHIEKLLWFLKQLPDQYPSVAHDYHHIIKALTYFTDAEDDPAPRLNFHANWRSVKKFFEEETIRVARELLRL